MLQVHGLSVEVGARLVVDGAAFTVRAGDKVGLVGRNGAGKTSLVRVLAGAAPATAGRVVRHGAVGYLPQEARPPTLLSPLGPQRRPLAGAATPTTSTGATALSHVLSGRHLDEAQRRLERRRLELEADPSAGNVDRFARAEDDFREAGGYSAEADGRRVLAGLGLGPDRAELPLAALSGGERRRAELGRILFANADVLLLDEPTNHLDLDAKAWLMAFLRSYRGALLVVSHDIELLDESITRVLHLDRGELVEYRGTYSQYRVARARDEERRAQAAARQLAQVRRLTALADSMRHQTQKRARTAKSLDKRVERLAAAAPVAPPRERRYAVRLPPPPHAGRVVLQAEDLAKGYGEVPVFEDVSLTLGRRERLLVMGLNGAGKTSLLRILAGVTAADGGEVRFGPGVSVGYYAQEHEGIVAGRDVIDHMRESGPAASVQDLRGLLGTMGLSGDVAFQDAGTLSGGEKTKLALAQLVAGRHNLLLLDEPTNNLDPPSREAVADALASWPGAVVLVSHDPGFVERLAPERVLHLPEGQLGFWSEHLLELVALA